MFHRLKWIVIGTLATITAGLTWTAWGSGTVNAEKPQTGQLMRVESIRIGFIHNGVLSGRSGGNSHPHAGALVKVVDDDGEPVHNATVTGNFSGCFMETGVSSKTGRGGVATLSQRFECEEACSLAFDVIDVSKKGAGNQFDQANSVLSATECLCDCE